MAGSQSDEVEEWLSRDFEHRAQEAIDRAIHDESVTSAHWKSLIRFVAAQDVRTPARLIESIQEWKKTTPSILKQTLRKAIVKLEEAKRAGIPVQPTRTVHSEYVPIRIRKEIVPGEAMGKIGVETVVGRGLWLFSLKHLLTSTLNILFKHRWTILRPHTDMCWFTSDDPVIKLNYNSPKDYNLNGGWGSQGTEILLPLGPKHLLYTQVGNRRPPERGSAFSREQTEILQKIITQHAHRMIFASAALPIVNSMRPRVVNPTAVGVERQEWEKWHAAQTEAEQELTTE